LANVVVWAELPGRLREILHPHIVVPPSELAEAAGLLSLLSVRVDEAFLDRAPKLRVIGNFAVGYDNIDVAACTRRGIVVCNTPGVLTSATAELTMALILGTARRLPEGLNLARSGQWTGWQPDQLLGLELDGARLGIVGLGRIGHAVAQRARAFGMHVAYSGRIQDVPYLHRGLDALLTESDIVSIHAPSTPATHHLIGTRELSLMRPGAILINTARGPILDENAVAEALLDDHLGGVGLDVFESEPQIHPALRAHPRALILPHLGSATSRTRTAMAETAAQGIAAVLAGRPPAHPVHGA